MQGVAEWHSSSGRSSSKNWQVRFHEHKEFCMGKKATERVKILTDHKTGTRTVDIDWLSELVHQCPGNEPSKSK